MLNVFGNRSFSAFKSQNFEKSYKINIKIQEILGSKGQKIVVFDFTVGIFGALEFVGILGASVSDRWE